MKKRALVFALLIGMIFSVISCSTDPNEEPNTGKDPRGQDGIVTVLLDAGHGFGDVGCTSEYLDGFYEYELNMDFVERLSEKLCKLGYTVLLTHDGKTFPKAAEICEEADRLGIEYASDKMAPENDVFDAYERAIYANVLAAETEIDFMLSIHVNASADTNTATGFEIDYCAENDSSQMTEIVFDSICASIVSDYPDRRLKQFADSWDMAFIVTKYTSMPSILFETGFASTPSDAELLLNDNWRDELMTTITEGIEEYFSIE